MNFHCAALVRIVEIPWIQGRHIKGKGMLRFTGLMIIGLLTWSSVQAWDVGSVRTTTLMEIGVHIVDGETVFIMKTGLTFPIQFPIDMEDECLYANLLGRSFFHADSENPSFAMRNMYVSALNSLSRGGRVTLEMGGCEMPPGDGPTMPEYVQYPEIERLPLRKVERLVVSE